MVGENLFIVQFANLEVRDWVLEYGPWHIQNKQVVVKKWEHMLSSPGKHQGRLL